MSEKAVFESVSGSYGERIRVTWQSQSLFTRRGVMAYLGLSLANYAWNKYSHGIAKLREKRKEKSDLTRENELYYIREGMSETSMFEALVFPFTCVRNIVPDLILALNPKTDSK